MGRYKRKAKKVQSPVKSNRPAKRKQWNEISMMAAMKAVGDGLCSINEAACNHAIPPTTLKDRMSGRVVHGTKPGPVPYLSSAEENELEKYLVDASKCGYGKTRKQIKLIVEKVAAEKGTLRSKCISDGWWKRFLMRHPKQSSFLVSSPSPLQQMQSSSLTTPTLPQQVQSSSLVSSPSSLQQVQSSSLTTSSLPLQQVQSSSLVISQSPFQQVPSTPLTSSPSPLQQVQSSSLISSPSPRQQVQSIPIQASTPHFQKENVVPHCAPTTPVRPPQRKIGCTSKSESSLTKYLQPLTELQPKEMPKTGKARVLTSSEYLAALNEKRHRKEVELAVKEKRKQERLLKKQEKEEAIRKRKEEREKRKQEKATTSNKGRNGASKEKGRPLTKGRERNLRSNTKTFAAASLGVSTEPSTSLLSQTIPLQAKDSECECAFCYGEYDSSDGQDWVMCACTNWVHEECIEEIFMDASGQERFCPFCLNRK